MNDRPTFSLNRGRLSLAYNPNSHKRIRRSIDRSLVEVAGLDQDFVDELQLFTEKTVAATLPQSNAE